MERVLIALYYYRSRFESPFSNDDETLGSIDETIRRINNYKNNYTV